MRSKRRMPHYIFSVTGNRFQQNEDGSTTTTTASALLNQIFPISTRQLATMTTRIEVLLEKLFSLFSFQSLTLSSSSTHHKQKTFAFSCSILLLLLVPFQVCQAMAVVVPLSRHSRSDANEVLTSNNNDNINNNIRSQMGKINPKFQSSTSRVHTKKEVFPNPSSKGQMNTYRITDHHCFQLKNDSSCANEVDCQWCKQWCIADVPAARMTCSEISDQLPEVTYVQPRTMLAGVPTLVIIIGRHLNTGTNSLLNVTFRLAGEEEPRNCTIVHPLKEKEIRCIIEGVDEKEGTLLYPKLRYRLNLRGNDVPGDIDSDDPLKIVLEGDQQTKPDEEDIVDNGEGKSGPWWAEMHLLHYVAGLLFIVGLVGGVASLLNFRRRQIGTAWQLLERRLLMGSMKKSLVKKGLYAEYASVTLKMKLGDGNFGEVYRAEVVSADGNGTKMEVAIKKLRKGSSLAQVKQFLTEGIRMSGFEHERILRPVAITLDSASPWMPAIVLPIMANGDLCRYLRKSKVFPIVRLLTFAVQIAEGMEYLASANFVHGDLAARNCLLDEHYQLKIGDFGLCRQLQYRSDYVTINDIYRPVRWMAVECLLTGGKRKSLETQQRSHHYQQPKFSLASDVWSFGVLLWEIFTLGSYPYEEFDNWSLVKAVAGGYRLHRPLNCPTAVYALMTSCWEVLSAQRPKIGQLRQQLAAMLAEVLAEMNGGKPSELAHSSFRSGGESSGYTSLAERFVQSRRISAQSTTSTRSTLSMASSVTTTSSHLA